MTRPGLWLRSIAALVYSERAMERLIDPVIADLQREYEDACDRGRVWKARAVRIAGYAALLKVIAVHGLECAARDVLLVSARDLPGGGRALALALVVTFVVMTLGIWAPMGELLSRPGADRLTLTFYLIPQALPLALPIGVAIGLLAGLDGRALTRRGARAVLGLAVICSIASYADIDRLVPAGNLAFRQAIEEAPVRKGANEMTLSELRARLKPEHAETLAPMAGRGDWRYLRVSYHARLAISCATLALALFALAVRRWRAVARVAAGVAVVIAYSGYYMILSHAVANARGVWIASPAAAAWLPNVLIAVASIAWMTPRAMVRDRDRRDYA